MPLDGVMFAKDGRNRSMTEIEKLEAGLEYCYDDP